MTEHMLDTKGLNCPLPILKAAKALKNIPTGESLQIVATDPGSVPDFEAFCRKTGNELIESKAEDGIYTFLIKRTA